MDEIEKEIGSMDEWGGGVSFCGGEGLVDGELLIDIVKGWGEEGIDGGVDRRVVGGKERVDEVMGNCEVLVMELK